METLEGLQLREAVQRVVRGVPFYSSYDADGELASFPVLRREALLSVNPTQFIAPELDLAAALASGKFRPLTTSGSTDEPLKVYADLELSLPPSVWAMHGLPDDARLTSLTSGVCLGTSCPGDIAQHGDRGLLLTFRAGLFEASDAHVIRTAEAFNAFKGDIAFVNPVWLHWLHRRAHGLGLSLHPVGGGSGAIVVGIQKPSPAEAGGLLVGDIVTTWESEPVRSVGDLAVRLGTGTVGNKIKLGVLRGGNALELDIAIGERPRG